MHLTGGILRHFQALSTPKQNPALEILSHPTHLQVTRAVGQQHIGIFEYTMMKWYKKQSITIRAAVIGGGFAIIAGIITGVVDAAIPNPPIIIQLAPTALASPTEITFSTDLPNRNITITPTATSEQVPVAPTFDRAKYQELVDFAYSLSGLSLASKSNASAWADANYTFFQEHNFELFKEIFSFAYSISGISMNTRIEAGEWALDNVTFFETHDFNEFKELFEYAYSTTGLNMATRKQAADWALEKMGR